MLSHGFFRVALGGCTIQNEELCQFKSGLDTYCDTVMVVLTCAHEDAGSDRGNGTQASCYARGAHANY